MAKNIYAKPEGVVQCFAHRLGLTAQTKAHLYTERGGIWWCLGSPKRGGR